MLRTSKCVLLTLERIWKGLSGDSLVAASPWRRWGISPFGEQEEDNELVREPKGVARARAEKCDSTAMEMGGELSETEVNNVSEAGRGSAEPAQAYWVRRGPAARVRGVWGALKQRGREASVRQVSENGSESSK